MNAFCVFVHLDRRVCARSEGLKGISWDVRVSLSDS